MFLRRRREPRDRKKRKRDRGEERDRGAGDQSIRRPEDEGLQGFALVQRPRKAGPRHCSGRRTEARCCRRPGGERLCKASRWRHRQGRDVREVGVGWHAHHLVSPCCREMSQGSPPGSWLRLVPGEIPATRCPPPCRSTSGAAGTAPRRAWRWRPRSAVSPIGAVTDLAAADVGGASSQKRARPTGSPNELVCPKTRGSTQ
jgi:hypothetical protein